MSDMRKGNLRQFQPSQTSGTDTVMGGANAGKEATKDSLTGKNSTTEYVPGKCPMGAGAPGGKGQRL